MLNIRPDPNGGRACFVIVYFCNPIINRNLTAFNHPQFTKKYIRLILAAVAIVFVAALYVLMQQSLPKYAARVPYLLLLFVLDLLVLGFLSPLWKNYPGMVKTAIQVFWWLPLAIMLFFLFGSVVVPMTEMPKSLRIYLPGMALVFFISKFFLFLPLLPAFILWLLQHFTSSSFRKIKLERGINLFKKMGIFLGSLALAGLLVGSTVWVYKFRLHKISLSIKALPHSLEGLRIVQISDIHLGSWISAKPLQRAVNQINELNPDVIVFTGDMVNYSTLEVRGFESTLAQLKAKYGVYAILGNHDYGDYVSWKSPGEKEQNLQQLVDFYENIGWKLLRNSVDSLKVGDASLLIAGVENWSATARFKKYGDMDKTMSGAKTGDVNILLSHDPTHWETEVFSRFPEFDLTLSGHTHGMQMGIEAFGFKWSPARYLYENWAGLTYETTSTGKKSYLYVNRGLGHIAYPGRVGILPEITLITLEKDR